LNSTGECFALAPEDGDRSQKLLQLGTGIAIGFAVSVVAFEAAYFFVDLVESSLSGIVDHGCWLVAALRDWFG
jgi:hypothetical protein